MIAIPIVQVREAIEASRAELLERRYTFPVGKLMGEDMYIMLHS